MLLRVGNYREYQDEHMNKHVQKFSGWVSEIVQHEMDHLEGILI